MVCKIWWYFSVFIIPLILDWIRFIISFRTSPEEKKSPQTIDKQGRRGWNIVESGLALHQRMNHIPDFLDLFIEQIFSSPNKKRHLCQKRQIYILCRTLLDFILRMWLWNPIYLNNTLVLLYSIHIYNTLCYSEISFADLWYEQVLFNLNLFPKPRHKKVSITCSV